ncbi:hypothetical protein VUR80DRAFT_2522 [Thermomyces stellatus]
MQLPLALSLAASVLCGATAHTIFVQLEAGGTTYDVGHGIRVPTYDGPQLDVTADTMACNGPPNPTTPSDKIIPVTAGSDVTAIWRHTLDSGPEDVMDSSHKGPVLAYLKKVEDATTDPGTGDGWSLTPKGNKSSIPECIEDGQYLLRAEMIALHGAASPGGAQFYMECAQIEITGGSGTANPELVSIPGVYPPNDPGIVIDIYNGLGNGYPTPGSTTLTC